VFAVGINIFVDLTLVNAFAETLSTVIPHLQYHHHVVMNGIALPAVNVNISSQTEFTMALPSHRKQ